MPGSGAGVQRNRQLLQPGASGEVTGLDDDGVGTDLDLEPLVEGTAEETSPPLPSSIQRTWAAEVFTTVNPSRLPVPGTTRRTTRSDRLRSQWVWPEKPSGPAMVSP